VPVFAPFSARRAIGKAPALPESENAADLDARTDRPPAGQAGAGRKLAANQERSIYRTFQSRLQRHASKSARFFAVWAAGE
jgi:hypothetical protein